MTDAGRARARGAAMVLAALLLGGLVALRVRPAAEGGDPPPSSGAAAPSREAPGDAAPATDSAAAPAPRHAAMPAGVVAGAPSAPAGARREQEAPAPARPARDPAAAPVSMTVTGRVVRPDGSPVEGAWVDVCDESVHPRDPFGVDDCCARSGSDGRFSLPFGRTSSDACVAFAALAGHRPGRSAAIQLADGATVDVGDLVLVPSGRGFLRAHLRRSDGRPFEGALLLLAVDLESGGPGQVRVAADPGGVVPPVAIDAGRYQMRASAAGFACAPDEVEVRDGATSDADLVLSWEGALVVRVLDDETGAPVEDADISLRERGAQGGAYAGRTDASGCLAIAGERPPGAYDLYVAADGYGALLCEGRTTSERGEPVPIVLREERREEPITVRMRRGRVVVGVVRDAEGRGVPSSLTLLDDRQSATAGATDAGGAFRLSGFGGGDEGTFRIVAHGGPPGLAWGAASFRLTPEAPRARVEIVRAAAASLAGRVLRAGGEPVAGAKVDAMPATPGGPSQPSEWGDPHAGRRVSASTGADGSYRLEGILPGPTDVIATASGHVATTRRAVELRSGENGLDLALSEGGTIAVRLVDDRGEPVIAGGVRVHATPSRDGEDRGSEAIEGLPDRSAQGRWVVEGLEDVPHDIEASASGHADGEAAGIRPGDGEVRIVLRRCARVALRVAFPPGASRPTSAIYAVEGPEGGGSASVRFGADGMPPLEIEPGATSLTVHFPGYAAASIALPPLGPGATHEVEVRPEQGRRVTGRVVGPDGAPVAGVFLAAAAAGSTWAGAGDGGLTDSDGAFVLADASRGAIEVSATLHAPGSPPSLLQATLELPAGGDVEGVELRLSTRGAR